MLTVPVMGANGNNTPKGLQPSLDVKLLSEWRYSDTRKIFVSSGGEEFSPMPDLPKGTKIHYMVPHLADADRATLTADERNLAQYLQIVFPKGTAIDRYLSVVGSWPCVEQAQRTPEVGLP